MFKLQPALLMIYKNVFLKLSLQSVSALQSFFSLYETLKAGFISHAAADHRTNPSKNFVFKAGRCCGSETLTTKESIQMIDYSIRAEELCSLNVRMKPTNIQRQEHCSKNYPQSDDIHTHGLCL